MRSCAARHLDRRSLARSAFERLTSRPTFPQGRTALRCSHVDDHAIKRGWEAEPPPPLLEVSTTPSHPSSTLTHA